MHLGFAPAGKEPHGRIWGLLPLLPKSGLLKSHKYGCDSYSRDWEFCMWDKSLRNKMSLRRFTKMVSNFLVGAKLFKF